VCNNTDLEVAKALLKWSDSPTNKRNLDEIKVASFKQEKKNNLVCPVRPPNVQILIATKTR